MEGRSVRLVSERQECGNFALMVYLVMGASGNQERKEELHSELHL